MDILEGFRNTGRDTANPPHPQDNDAGGNGEQVPKDDELDTRHACTKHVVDSINRFYSEDTRVLCADGQEIYMRLLRYTVVIPCIN